MPHVVPADLRAIQDATERLRRHDVVAFPTETVYGLGADTFSPRAIQRVYELKGRPTDNPLIAHASDVTMARDLLARGWDDRAQALASAFWPGPLTIIMQKHDAVPSTATGGRDTVAIRVPAHPVAQALLRAFGGPVSAPSANRSGLVSATAAGHVARDFADIDNLLILDGGASQVGIESTVIDLTRSPAALLREGAVPIDHLRRTIGRIEAARLESQDASPGTAMRHYAPRTLLLVVENANLRRQLIETPGRAVVITLDPSLARTAEEKGQGAIIMDSDAAAYASSLYDALRRADEASADRILLERPPRTDGLWAAIHDRLRRASMPAPGRTP